MDRDEASAVETCRVITDEGGVAEPFVADVRDEEQCRALVEAATQLWGRLDVLHNIVGIGAGDGDAQTLDERAWDLIMDVNLRGMWLTSRHAIVVMRDQGSGAVVNV